MIHIDERCTACGACIQTCPTKALMPAPKRPVLLQRLCNNCMYCLEVCPAGAITSDEQPGGVAPNAMAASLPSERQRHPIEAESYSILERRVDLSHMEPLVAEVVARTVHATADVELARLVVASTSAVLAGIQALREGASVVCDVEMTRAAISPTIACCHLPPKKQPAGRPGLRTRSAEGILRAAMHHGNRAIWAIGCAPTALEELTALVASGEVSPTLVIGTPVGFVGAARAKQALRELDVPSISTRGERGGAAVAGAILNALARLADVNPENVITNGSNLSKEAEGRGEQDNDR